VYYEVDFVEFVLQVVKVGFDVGIVVDIYWL
jgi:hypothetical protein